MNFLSDTLLSQENGEMGKCRQVCGNTLCANSVNENPLEFHFNVECSIHSVSFHYIQYRSFFPSIRLISLKLLFEYTVHCTLCVTGAAMM